MDQEEKEGAERAAGRPAGQEEKSNRLWPDAVRNWHPISLSPAGLEHVKRAFGRIAGLRTGRRRRANLSERSGSYLLITLETLSRLVRVSYGAKFAFSARSAGSFTGPIRAVAYFRGSICARAPGTPLARQMGGPGAKSALDLNLARPSKRLILLVHCHNIGPILLAPSPLAVAREGKGLSLATIIIIIIMAGREIRLASAIGTHRRASCISLSLSD